MYAVIQTGGKQYRVAPGESIEVETLTGDVGADVEFDRVVAVIDGDSYFIDKHEKAAGGLTGRTPAAGLLLKKTVGYSAVLMLTYLPMRPRSRN